MNEFHVILKSGEAWVYADYVLPEGENWNFYRTTPDGEQVEVLSYPMDKVKRVLPRARPHLDEIRSRT